jgi:hypothetical protein
MAVALGQVEGTFVRVEEDDTLREIVPTHSVAHCATVPTRVIFFDAVRLLGGLACSASCEDEGEGDACCCE